MTNMIYKEWSENELTKFVHLKHGYQFRTPDFSEHGVKVIKISQVIGGGKIDLASCDHVPHCLYNEKKGFSLKTGDLLMSLTGNIGRVGIVPKTNQPLLQNYRVGLFIPIEGQCLSSYLLHLLSSEGVISQLSNNSNSTAQANFGKADLDKVIVKIPPLPEQQKIAAILTSVDEVIERTQLQINKLQDLKKATMNDLLTKGIGHTEFKDSPVGRIPKCWKVHSLDDLTDPKRPITYGIVQAGPHIDNGVPYIRVSDMKGESLSIYGMLKTSPEIAQKFTRSAVGVGDIVYALRGDIGKVLPVPEALNGANLTQGTALISKSERISMFFLIWAMRSENVMVQTNDLAKGSTFSEMTLGNLKKVLIPVPPEPEQNTISSILDELQNTITTKNQKLEHLGKLKKSLMQDLLTGKVRVKVD
jgi:type I restriction enzyme S subunit